MMPPQPEQFASLDRASIPAELRERQQWVRWKLVTRKGDDAPTKIPFMTNGKPASSTDPAT